MANVFIGLPVPAGNGVGAWVDVSSMGPERTLSVDGGAFDGSILIEGSNDAQASSLPAAVGPFTGPTSAPQTFVQAWNFLRVRRTRSSGIGTPLVNVAAPPSSGNAFGAVAVPTNDGTGAPFSIAAGGDIVTVGVSGDGFTGQLFIETSTDGAAFSPTFLFTGPAVVFFKGVLNAIRARRAGSTGGLVPLVSVGSQALGGAGTSAAITALIGPDVIAVGPGAVAGTLVPTTVIPGSYSNGNFQVDANGRLLNASNGSAGGGAAWPIGFNTRRYFAIDFDNGNDANAGFSDVSAAAAGLVAKKTWTGMGAIFPRVGSGRSYELIVASSATDYTTGLNDVFPGAFGYANDSIIRGTGTNATAASVAFAGDANDLKYAGFVTIAGMNASGYTTDAGTGTLLTLTKVGGGVPAFTGEPALPMGWRFRFSSTTTTVALQNISYPVVKVLPAGGAAIRIDTSITRVGTDVGFLEYAGVSVPAYSLGAGNQGISIIGIRSRGKVNLAGYGNGRFAFFGCASVATQPIFCSIYTDQTFIHPSFGNIKIGCAYRDDGITELGDCDSHLALWCATTGLIVTNALNHEDFGAQIFGRYFVRGTLPLTGVTHEHAVIGNGGSNFGAGAKTRLAAADVDLVSLELNSAFITIDGLEIENGVGGSVQCKGLYGVAIGTYGLVGTAVAPAAFDVSPGHGGRVILADTSVVTATGTKSDIALCAGPENGTFNIAYAPWSTLSNLVFGGLTDCAGNILQGGVTGGPVGCNAELIGPVVGLKNTTGAPVAQWSLVTEGGAHNIFLPKANNVGNAAGLAMVLLTPALANNDWVLCALQVMRAPLIFDAPPAQSVLVYMSTTNFGQVQTAVPVAAGTNQKYRLGLTTRNSSGVSVNAAYFNPELFPTLADGQP